MASNSFGNIFQITTWGESHGKGLGVVIDGCPAGLNLNEADINEELAKRAPGKNPYTSPRKEEDRAEIYSGVFEGKTTGAPISIVIKNHDADTSKYEDLKNILRPGHANYTYLEKYGIFDYRGGGRSSARETICRVAAAAVAKKLLAHFSIEVFAYIVSIADIKAKVTTNNISSLKNNCEKNPLYCPDLIAAEKMKNKLNEILNENSVGGVVEFIATGIPVGLGDPVYEKLEANLAKAMLSIPASKGFEIGDGFSSSHMLGSEHNDQFISEENKVYTATNHAGGTLGGITTGMPLIGRVAFKPTSSIQTKQTTLDLFGKECEFTLPEGSRHDPCVAIRGVPVVNAMCALVLADALLLNRCVKL